MEGVQDTFKAYAGAQDEIALQTFVKIFQDLHLVDSDLTEKHLAAIFLQRKTFEKKIDFGGFKLALKDIAKKKDLDLDQIVTVVASSKGPKVKGTVPQRVRFHDDKANYTGVYREGGPAIVDTGKTKIDDLSQITDRQEANIRGLNKKFVK